MIVWRIREEVIRPVHSTVLCNLRTLICPRSQAAGCLFLAVLDRVIFVFAACSELWKVLSLAPSVCRFFVYEMSLEPLNGFAPNSHRRRVWSIAWTSLKVKVTRNKNSIFRPFRRPACSLCLVKHL